MPIVLKFYWKLFGYFYRHCFPSDSLAQSEYLNCRINFFKSKEDIFRDLLNPYFWRRKCQKIRFLAPQAKIVRILAGLGSKQPDNEIG